MPSETTYTSLRKNLASVLDRVIDEQDIVIVRRRGSAGVALIPASELAGLMETAPTQNPRTMRGGCRGLCIVQSGAGPKQRLWPGCGGKRYVTREPKRLLIFHPEFRQDLRHWIEFERKTALRILDLVESVARDSFSGPGKPELLQYILAGWLVQAHHAGTPAGIPCI